MNEQIKLEVEKIINNAQNSTLLNCVPTKLTYQQAFSILLRSRQLSKENGHLQIIDNGEKAKQIEACYAQRLKEKSY